MGSKFRVTTLKMAKVMKPSEQMEIHTIDSSFPMMCTATKVITALVQIWLVVVPTKYDRDTITGSYELDTEHHKGKITLYSSETEIDRDESVITSRWATVRHSRNTATNRNIGANIKFQSDYQVASLNNQVTYGGK